MSDKMSGVYISSYYDDQIELFMYKIVVDRDGQRTIIHANDIVPKEDNTLSLHRAFIDCDERGNPRAHMSYVGAVSDADESSIHIYDDKGCEIWKVVT